MTRGGHSKYDPEDSYGVVIETADHDDSGALKKIANSYLPHLVIDDGSHVWDEQKLCFENIFPCLQPGGLYVIEDIQTCFGEYVKKYGSSDSQSPYEWIMSMTSNLAAGLSSPPLTKRDIFEKVFQREVESVTVRNQLLTIAKRTDISHFHEVVDLVSSAHTVTIVPSEPYTRVSGTLISAMAHVENRFKKLSAEKEVKFAESGSGFLNNARVHGFGIVIDEQERLIKESLNCVSKGSTYFEKVDERIWKSLRPDLEEIYVPKVPGRQHVLLKSVWDRNYGHWLSDSYAKLSLLHDLDLQEKPIFVVNPQKGPMQQVVRESLALAGFNENDYMTVDIRTHRFESLLILGSVSWHPNVKRPRAVKFLEEITESVSFAGVERIYLSRNQYGRRMCLNEDDIWPEFESRGFVKVNPETLSFTEQIALFKDVKWVAGNMGGAFSNLLFAPAGVSVIALATPKIPHDYFYDIVCHKRGRYFVVCGTACADRPSLASDFVVNIDDVRKVLQLVE